MLGKNENDPTRKNISNFKKSYKNKGIRQTKYSEQIERT